MRSSSYTSIPWTSSITCNYIICFNLPWSKNRPLSILQREISCDDFPSTNWGEKSYSYSVRHRGQGSGSKSGVIYRHQGETFLLGGAQGQHKVNTAGGWILDQTETLKWKCVCVYTVCGGVSLLSIASGQHKSDMTFPQDVKLQEIGGHSRWIVNLKLIPPAGISFFLFHHVSILG